MSETTQEQRLRAAMPDGFKSTIADEDRLRDLDNADTSVLNNTVQDYASYTLTEADLIQWEIQRVLSGFLTSERTLELPGLGLEMEQNHINKWAARYKVDNETPSGSVKPPRLATTDDIVFSFASPEVYEEISGQAQDTFEASGLTSGNTYEVIDDTGLADSGAQSANASLQLDSDEMLYFTGDFIDLSGGQSEITKIEWADIDGESYGPDDGMLSARLSGAHLMTAQGAWVKSTVDLDAKVYADGDTELVPIAFYMGPGTKAPALV